VDGAGPKSVRFSRMYTFEALLLDFFPALLLKLMIYFDRCQSWSDCVLVKNDDQPNQVALLEYDAKDRSLKLTVSVPEGR